MRDNADVGTTAETGAPFDAEGRRVVLVHDWLTGMRGGEKVLESLCRLFPTADLLTLVHARGSVSPLIEARRIRASIVQHLPRPVRFYRHYLPIFPTAIEGFDLDDVDLVISTSHCAAKSVVPSGRATHVCYCHSPMRYAWDQFESYFGRERLGRAGSAAARPVLAWLARWDRATAGRVTHFVANSRFVAGRIGRYYNREASVLHPPVDTRFFTPGDSPPQPYFLVVSALVPYKRLDVAVRAATRLGVHLKVVGTGPDLGRLRAQADGHTTFLGAVDAPTLRDLYRHALGLVLPAEEDFGIAPVEAMACGRPVVALGRGGATETVVPGLTGQLVETQSVEAFADAMDHVQRGRYDAGELARHAAHFSLEQFELGLRRVLTQALADTSPC
ncbi:MAG: glycosyltransferase [Acidobacteria bacterium]|nr:glycosyltransferase [Acidobacteriota bacterium]